MEIKDMVKVDRSNQRVLLYVQVAAGLKCSVDRLRSLYKDHKNEFVEGVHFFNVEGEALRTLKWEMRNRHVDSACPSFGKGARCLKLWTCQGVARLSKLIDTPQAWELFTELEQSYFESKVEPVQPELPFNKQFSAAARRAAERDFKEFKANQAAGLLVEPTPLLDDAQWNHLLDLLNVPIDSPAKEQLIRQTANLLLGKNLF